MKLSRRTFLQTAAIGGVVIGFLPRMALAAPGKIRSYRTGVQPGGKTRIVIETSVRPTYSVSYPDGKLVVALSNTAADTSVKPTLASGTLVSNLAQTQSGDKLLITATLNKSIANIPKENIFILNPNGDSDYRLVLDFVAGAGTATAAAATTAAPVKKYQPVIVIDAGHGGKDPGCIGASGTKEKTVVLNVAKKLKTKLDAAGFKTYMTRNSDVFLELQKRAELSEKHNADLFLSLHANANPSKSMKGFSIYTLSKTASDEEAQKLADAENEYDRMYVKGFKDFEENIRIALSSLQQQALAGMSLEYARGCVRSMRNAGVTQQAGDRVRSASFAVLRGAVPGALLEIGHLSNKAEEKLLNTASHQDKLVAAIVKSIQGYDFEV
jgi:N-acetylmuramoyl-L-alanine amidase